MDREARKQLLYRNLRAIRYEQASTAGFTHKSRTSRGKEMGTETQLRFKT
jgi:hypothetical protein